MSPPGAPSAQKTFLLGVGAQKAGTTWLADYLASAPNVAASSIKEYHVWDALHVPSCEHFIRTSGDLSDSDKLRALMQRKTGAYFDFFNHLLDRLGKAVTFDITPSYAGLKAEILCKIITGFSERNIATKAVFLMRDPVERCWSAARMYHHERHGSTDIQPEHVAAMARLPDFNLRTRYDATLSSLKSAFQPETLHVGIYEEMFAPAPLQALSLFCGVPFRPELSDKPVYASAKQTELSHEVASRIARHYRGVYDAVASTYPQVQQLWRGFQYL